MSNSCGTGVIPFSQNTHIYTNLGLQSNFGSIAESVGFSSRDLSGLTGSTTHVGLAKTDQNAQIAVGSLHDLSQRFALALEITATRTKVERSFTYVAPLADGQREIRGAVRSDIAVLGAAVLGRYYPIGKPRWAPWITTGLGAYRATPSRGQLSAPQSELSLPKNYFTTATVAGAIGGLGIDLALSDNTKLSLGADYSSATGWRGGISFMLTPPSSACRSLRSLVSQSELRVRNFSTLADRLNHLLIVARECSSPDDLRKRASEIEQQAQGRQPANNDYVQGLRDLAHELELEGVTADKPGTPANEYERSLEVLAMRAKLAREHAATATTTTEEQRRVYASKCP